MLKFAKKVDVFGIKLYYEANTLKWNRFTVVLKRGFKNAIHRNRERRIVKECYRNLKNGIDSGWDLVFLIFPGTNTYSKRFSQMSQLFKKAGLMAGIENR